MELFLIICGILLLRFLFIGFWAWLVEVVSPFKYTMVPLSELGSHFTEFFRRGYNKSQMIVHSENMPVFIKLRKEVSTFTPGYKVRMIFGFDESLKFNTDNFRKFLQEENMPFEYGFGGFSKNQFGVFVDCDDSVDIATKAANVIVLKYFELDSENTFEVWVKGPITWRDMLIDSREPNTGTVWYMTLSGAIPLGKPYKRAHIPGKYSKYTLSALLGKVVGMFMHLFKKQ